MVRRRIAMEEGMSALAAWARDSDAVSRSVVVTAVRFTLEEIGALHPGRSVEVRVPPVGAVQILPGTTHRRGTPPAVVEMETTTWLALAIGTLTWQDALERGSVTASGERANLAPYLPVIDLPADAGASESETQASI